MKFLDLNGLKHLLTKIKVSFGTAIVESSRDPNIPFVANHQIVNVNRSGNINVYDWFQKASRGGILEIFFAGAQGGDIYCHTNNNNYMYKMNVSSHGPHLDNIDHLDMSWNIYVRLIKTNDTKLVVAEYVQNK